MVGERPGRRGRDLDGVEAGHRDGARRESPPRREGLRVADGVGAGGEEVGVEGHDDVGRGEVVAGLDGLPNARRAPARAASRPAASHWCHFAFGNAASNACN